MVALRTRSLLLALVAGAVPVLAQTTGTVQGRVLDSKGSPVRGALVRLSGAGIQGRRTTTSDMDGYYRFSLLNPGRCIVMATKDGLSAVKSEVLVGLDKTATLDLTMGPIASATVEVVEQSTEVDVKTTTVGANYPAEVFTKLPTSRDYALIAILAPGVTQDNAGGLGGGLKIYGGTGAENSYVVDGINTTNVEFGTQGKKVPVEFIQEFQIKTGGYEAEYGKALGGIINVITKSGGNEFTGDVFTYFDGNSLRANNKHEGQSFFPVPVSSQNAEYGFDFGGPIIKDKLWFFVAYDRNTSTQKNTILGSADTATTDGTRDLFAGKLTWRISENQTLVASFLGDPETDTGAVKTPLGPSSTWDGERKVGGTDLSLRYEFSGESWFAELQVSRHNESNTILPQGVNGDEIQYVDNRAAGNGATSGGFGRFDDKKFTRDTISGSFTKIFPGHEIKAGFDLQTDKADIRRGYSGGQTVTMYDNTGNPAQPIIYTHYYWTSADASINLANPANSFVPSIIFTSKPKHESQAYFVQDKWTLNSHWNFNLGLRLDQTDIKNQFGDKVISLKDEWAPRFGVVYDWNGKGQDKVFASFSRFYEQIPLDLVIRSFSVERNPTIVNYSPTSTVINTQAENDFGFDPSLRIVGSYIEPVDRDLKGSYNDEFILGAETTLNNLYVVGAKFIRRYLGRAVEDGLDVNSALGDYFIMNPGQSHDAGVTYPQAIRDYKGVELMAQRKLSDHYAWQLSYLWSKLDGNYEGAYQGIGGADGTGQLDPNINSAFDLPEFIVNSYGPLSGDRQGEFKANGYYEFPFGLSVGANFSYLTGTPVSRLGFHNGYGRYELFLLPRGSEGRTPSVTKLDLNFAYTWRISGKRQVRLMLDVFNVLDSQTALSLDQRFNFKQDDPQTNTNYLQGNSFQAPRTIRLGLRFSF